jgi:hypothetical protein
LDIIIGARCLTHGREIKKAATIVRLSWVKILPTGGSKLINQKTISPLQTLTKL